MAQERRMVRKPATKFGNLQKKIIRNRTAPSLPGSGSLLPGGNSASGTRNVFGGGRKKIDSAPDPGSK